MNNWKQFTRRIPIKAPAKAIYDAWTTQQGLESWFLRMAAFTDATGEPEVAAAELLQATGTNGSGMDMTTILWKSGRL